MKIRTGFVSNSSSSSFVITGLSKKQIDALKTLYYNNNAYDHEKGIYELDMNFFSSVVSGEVSIHATSEFYKALEKLNISQNTVEWDN
jgi:hypothetical protein